MQRVITWIDRINHAGVTAVDQLAMRDRREAAVTLGSADDGNRLRGQ
jgi:hypothetical protein